MDSIYSTSAYTWRHSPITRTQHKGNGAYPSVNICRICSTSGLSSLYNLPWTTMTLSYHVTSMLPKSHSIVYGCNVYVYHKHILYIVYSHIMTSKNLFTRLYMISYQYDTYIYIYIYDSILDKIIYIILCIYISFHIASFPLNPWVFRLWPAHRGLQRHRYPWPGSQPSMGFRPTNAGWFWGNPVGNNVKYIYIYIYIMK